MSELLKINVNGHIEQKNGLSYLSWAWAWAEVLKIDPNATWEVIEYGQPDGTTAPCMYVGGGTAMVKTKVTIKEKTRTCVLPVMNHKNQAIKDPDAFAINTAIMRCMTKAISMHGLGLYVYAGEDLPEGEEPDLGEFLTAIAEAESEQALKSAYASAFKATQGNATAQKKVIAAKDARKAELQGQPA